MYRHFRPAVQRTESDHRVPCTNIFLIMSRAHPLDKGVTGASSTNYFVRDQYCLPTTRHAVGILIKPLYEAQWPGPLVPLSTLQPTPHDVTCKTRGKNGVAVSFPVEDLHLLQHAGLSRRSSDRGRLFRHWSVARLGGIGPIRLLKDGLNRRLLMSISGVVDRTVIVHGVYQAVGGSGDSRL
jgi:hypothetical protein